MDVDLQAHDGVDMHMSDAHGGALSVGSLDGQADGAQPALRGPCAGDRIALVEWDEYAAIIARITASSRALVSPLSS